MKRSVLFVLLAGLAGFLVVQWLHNEGWFDSFEQAANDWRFRKANESWQPLAAHAERNREWVADADGCRVVIVALGDRAAAWPPATGEWRAAVEHLRRWGVLAVGIEAALDDSAAATAVASFAAGGDPQRALPLVLARHGAVDPAVSADADRPAIPWADATLTAEPDGVVRKIAPVREPTGRATFARQLAAHLPSARNAEHEDRRTHIPFVGPPGAIPRVSLDEVVAGEIAADTLAQFGVRTAAELFGSRVVMIGATTPGQYVGPAGAESVWGVRTPYYDSREARSFLAARRGVAPADVPAAWTRMPSVEVHANAVQMFGSTRSAGPLHVAAPDRDRAVLIAACLVMVLAVALLPPIASFGVLVVLGIGLYLGTQAMLRDMYTFYSALGPTIGATFTFVCGTLASYVVERRERQYITQMFAKYLSPQVIKQMAASKEPPKLGGEKRPLTILFSDLTGFTTWSEKLGAERLLELLNEYLGAMTEIVFRHHGTLDKYMGDAVMAFWNAPLGRRDHEMRACEAALEMIDRLAELNRGWQATGLTALRMRIGIHTGDAVVGNAGSGERFDYTAFGDSVNLASRLEGTAKRYGVPCIISADTFEGAGGRSRLLVRELDTVRVFGRSQPVEIFELIGTAKEGRDAQTAEYRKLTAYYEEGLDAYREHDWPRAIKALKAAQAIAPDDVPAQILTARVRRFMKTPPPANWDGSVDLTTK